MVIELVSFHIKPGCEDEFLTSGRQHAKNMTREHEGCHSVEFGIDADDPSQVLAVVHWASREAYTRFSTSEERLGWRKTVEGLLTAPPSLRFLQDLEMYAAHEPSPAKAS